MIYNGVNAEPNAGGDPRLKYCAHHPAQALFDRSEPTRLLKRSTSPFKGGDAELEKQPVVFWIAPVIEAWSLVPFKGELLLYWNHNFGRRSVGLWKAAIRPTMSTHRRSNEAARKGHCRCTVDAGSAAAAFHKCGVAVHRAAVGLHGIIAAIVAFRSAKAALLSRSERRRLRPGNGRKVDDEI